MKSRENVDKPDEPAEFGQEVLVGDHAAAADRLALGGLLFSLRESRKSIFHPLLRYTVHSVNASQ